MSFDWGPDVTPFVERMLRSLRHRPKDDMVVIPYDEEGSHRAEDCIKALEEGSPLGFRITLNYAVAKGYDPKKWRGPPA